MCQDWFLGAAHQIEQIKTADGKTLTNSNVNALVDAMALFAAPGAAENTLLAHYVTKL